jgi:hypothetical protein
LVHVPAIFVRELDVWDAHTHNHLLPLGRPGWKPYESNEENARHKSDVLVEKYISNAELIWRNLEDNPALCMKQKLGPPMECLLVSGQ